MNFHGWLLIPLLATAVAASDHAGRRAPGFSLPDANLQQHDLYDYRGKVVVLEFMQTRCPVCQQMTKLLATVQETYKDRVAVLSIAVPPDQVSTVQQFIAEFKVTNPVLIDCGSVTLSYLRPPPHAPTVHVPHLFVIDRDGVIRNDFHHDAAHGGFSEPELFAEIDKLAGPPLKKK